MGLRSKIGNMLHHRASDERDPEVRFAEDESRERASRGELSIAIGKLIAQEEPRVIHPCVAHAREIFDLEYPSKK